MRRTPQWRSDLRVRSGLTLVEVLVALVIVSVGLLGVAGTSALALRTTTAAAREQAALGRLELHLAALAAARCAPAITGSVGDLDSGVRERWTQSAPSRGVALVDATAEWRDGGVIRSIALRSAILC
jgi:prepilin-type N-terminal cleavage/methylation domain-containing protein